jgi:hypothetical protein
MCIVPFLVAFSSLLIKARGDSGKNTNRIILPNKAGISGNAIK